MLKKKLLAIIISLLFTLSSTGVILASIKNETRCDFRFITVTIESEIGCYDTELPLVIPPPKAVARS